MSMKKKMIDCKIAPSSEKYGNGDIRPEDDKYVIVDMRWKAFRHVEKATIICKPQKILDYFEQSGHPWRGNIDVTKSVYREINKILKDPGGMNGTRLFWHLLECKDGNFRIINMDPMISWIQWEGDFTTHVYIDTPKLTEKMVKKAIKIYLKMNCGLEPELKIRMKPMTQERADAALIRNIRK